MCGLGLPGEELQLGVRLGLTSCHVMACYLPGEELLLAHLLVASLRSHARAQPHLYLPRESEGEGEGER